MAETNQTVQFSDPGTTGSCGKSPVHGNPDLVIHDDESITVGHDRVLVCLSAAWELEELALHLAKVASNGPEETPHFVVRCMAGRIKELSHVLMGALNDDMEKTDHLMATVLVSNTMGAAT